MFARTLCLCSILTTVGGAVAYAEPQEDPKVSVTVEPMFLAAAILEANVEVEVTPHLGLQALAGYGGMLGSHIAELGAEANVYVRPEMRGWHFGTELKYLWASGPSIPFVDLGMASSTVELRELAVYAGYKWVGWHHITTVVQFGIGRMDSSGDTMDVPKSQVVPAANLVLGYSF